MIDIIIPAYNAHDTIKRTLISVLLQNNVKELNIYIIDDCSEKDYQKEYDLFKNKMNLTLYRLKKNRGPGFARQYGIEHSNSKYIMFLDCDDIFYNNFSVENVFKKIENENLDVVIGNVNEVLYGYNRTYLGCFDDLHAKIYRRSFIQKNNIFFPSFYNGEDTAFNNLFYMYLPKEGYVDSLIYMYIRRKNSLTTLSNFHPIELCCRAIEWAVKIAEEKKICKKNIAKSIFNTLIYICYCCYDENIKIKYGNDLYNLYKKYKIYILREDIKELIIFWFNDISYLKVFEQFVFNLKNEIYIF